MTRFDDELEYLCAWGRWRIGQARNDPVLQADAPVDMAAQRERVVQQRGVARLGRARLRLVAAPARVAL